MSHTLSREEIQRLAMLARLDVPEAELESIGADIANILGFVDRIQNVQLDSEAAEGTGEVNVFRDDSVDPLVAVHDLVEVAPLHQDHFVKVPKVIE